MEGGHRPHHGASERSGHPVCRLEHSGTVLRRLGRNRQGSGALQQALSSSRTCVDTLPARLAVRARSARARRRRRSIRKAIAADPENMGTAIAGPQSADPAAQTAAPMGGRRVKSRTAACDAPGPATIRAAALADLGLRGGRAPGLPRALRNCAHRHPNEARGPRI